MSAPPVVVTTSWDDGHHLDSRLAGLLADHDLPATFYVATRNVEIPKRNRLSAAALREIARHFEIGGHTLNHLPLTTLSEHEAEQEIRNGKDELEGMLGRSLTSFCYPLGRYRATHVRLVEKAGFTVARTVKRARLDPGHPLEMATTANAYRHLVDGPQAVRLARFRPGRTMRYFQDWDELAMRWFDSCLRGGGVFHLWGHSWEVDQRGDWDRLTRVLAYIARRPGVRYVPNAGVVGAAR